MLSSLNKFTYISEESTTPIFRVCPRMQHSLFLRNAGHFQHRILEVGILSNARCTDCLKIIDRPKSEIYLSCLVCAISFDFIAVLQNSGDCVKPHNLSTAS